MGLAVAKPKGDPLSTIDLLHRVVALMCDARDGGWEIACFQTGNFSNRDYFRVEFQRSPPAESPRPELAASTANAMSAPDEQNPTPTKTK